jgi:hypothetical protein
VFGESTSGESAKQASSLTASGPIADSVNGASSDRVGIPLHGVCDPASLGGAGSSFFYVALFRDAPGVVGKLIRWQTRSRYSHAALVFDREFIREIDPTYRLFCCGAEFNHGHALTHKFVTIEAREFRGVRLTMGVVTTPATNVDLFAVEPFGATPKAAPETGALPKIWFWAKDELAKDYDYTMVARFVSRRQASRTESDKWFCSELVFAALRKAGIELLRDVEPWAVSPGLLAKSPLLKFQKTIGPVPLPELLAKEKAHQ